MTSSTHISNDCGYELFRCYAIKGDKPVRTSEQELSATYQHKVGEFVSREVIYCVSTLIHNLAKNDSGEYWEDICSICLQDDWIEPATNHARDMDREQCVKLLEQISIDSSDDEDIGTLREAICANISDETIDPEEFCAEWGLDPYQNEALEHWVVSSWLAEKLQDKSEMVSTDIHGLTVWGRTTSASLSLWTE